MRQKPRLLVVEDDELIRTALEVALEEEGYAVETEADSRGVEAAAGRFRPDLAILDVHLPGGPDGYTVARRLRGSSTLPILFLTGADAVADRVAGFEAGGDDYMAKPFAVEELLVRIRALLRRSGRLSSGTWQVGDLVVDDGRRAVLRQGQPVDLTPAEYQLLSLLVRHPGQILSRGQLLDHLHRPDLMDSNVVAVHMSALRRKLEAHGPRLIHTVRGVGYVLRT